MEMRTNVRQTLKRCSHLKVFLTKTLSYPPVGPPLFLNNAFFLINI